MEGLLRVISGPNVGACFVLEERTRVGRAADADIQLDEPHVSRQHARIRRQPDGGFELTDLGSTSGTTVNGAPVNKKVLQPNDVIAIGLCRFSFEFGTGIATASSFSNKARGFATLRPTQPVLAVPVATPPAAVAKRRRRRTQRQIPAMRDARPLAARPEQREKPEQSPGEGAENLLDAILGPQTDVVVDRSGEAANEDSGPKLAASNPGPASVATPSAVAAPVPVAAPAFEAAPAPSPVPPRAPRPASRAAPVPAVPRPASRAVPVPAVPRPVSRAVPVPRVTRESRAEPASAPPPGRHSLGTPNVVPVTESGALGFDFDPQAREAALSTLRDVLDYRALRLSGLRGEPMDARAKARFEQLSIRLLVDTHGLPSSRRFLRQPCPLPATLTQRDGALSRTLDVSLDDLSAGGARLSMVDPSVRVGDEVWIAFDLAALFSFGQKVVFRSRVVWTSGRIGATGLMFGGNARFVETVEAAIATG